MKARLLDSNGREEEHHSAVTNLCTTADGTLVAVAIQRQVSQKISLCLKAPVYLFILNNFGIVILLP